MRYIIISAGLLLGLMSLVACSDSSDQVSDDSDQKQDAQMAAAPQTTAEMRDEVAPKGDTPDAPGLGRGSPDSSAPDAALSPDPNTDTEKTAAGQDAIPPADPASATATTAMEAADSEPTTQATAEADAPQAQPSSGQQAAAADSDTDTAQATVSTGTDAAVDPVTAMTDLPPDQGMAAQMEADKIRIMSEEQQARFNKLLGRWEKQADRYDALLSKWESEARTGAKQ